MPRILPVNRSTVLVEVAELDEVLALHASLTLEPVAGIEEMLPAARTLMLRFDPVQLSPERIAQTLSQRDLSRAQPVPGLSIEIPMRYDGEDLAEVAQISGLPVEEVIRRHQASTFTVAFCGFAPGFAYLVGGDPVLHVPRRSTPRAQVPAGSVALGGVYCGVYPQATPGGWRIIGTTTLPMWDPARVPPALLTAGMRVRFVEGDAAPSARQPSGQRVTDRPGPRITVRSAMLPALLQDLGRSGHAHMGVAPSGAMDRSALQAANGAVGNPPGSPCLEIALGNFAFEASEDIVVALAGAPAPMTVQRASGESLEATALQPIRLGPGDRVKIGYPARGVRSYLAVRGGFEVPRVLGSASRDTLAALGPEPVVKGSVLMVGRGATPVAGPGTAPGASVAEGGGDESRAAALPASGDTVELDVSIGPRADWFSDGSIAVLLGQPWQVTPQSSRVGIRLKGAQELQRRSTTELPSEGIVRGAIQVPHDGQPVLLLADHPLTGGYPVIGVVAEHHLDLAGQIPPGAKIRFRRLAPSR